MDIDTARDEILQAMLDNVVFDGWTERSLKESLAMTGYDRAVADRAFPNGMADILSHFSAWADRQMADMVEGEGDEFHRRRTGDKVTHALQRRFEVLEPHKEAVRRSLAVFALPTYAPLGPRLLYDTVDTIWRLAGDSATDFNFYTKRAALAGILSSATLYWINDQSPDDAETRDFVARRVARLDQAGRAVHRYGRIGGLTEAPWRVAARLRDRVAARTARRRAPPPGGPAAD
ncbi:MAG: COQ9 family protein [Alphaproteobacteria bacterium]|jgi:ubiquinone biosynthesis protein COQ9|nr:COQ9 family protein [Alphaproteobacteria bacterium]